MRQLVLGASNPPSVSATGYLGIHPGATWNATESAVSNLIPIAGTFRNLYIVLSNAPGAGKSYTLTLMKDGVATSLSVTISNTDVSGQLTGTDVSFSGGETASIRCVPSGTPDVLTNLIWWSCEFESVSSLESLLICPSGTTLNTDGTNGFIPIVASTISLGGSHDSVSSVYPHDATLKELHVLLSGSPGTGNSYTFSIYKNGVLEATSLVTISNTDVEGSVTGLSIDVVPGDTLSIGQDSASSPTARTAKTAIVVQPDTPGHFPLFVTSPGTGPSTTTTQFGFVGKFNTIWSSTEAARKQLIGTPHTSVTLSRLYIDLAVAPGSGKSRTFTIRNDGVDTSLSAAVLDTNKVASDTSNTAVIMSGDFISVEATPLGTPSNTGVRVGMTAFIDGASASPSLSPSISPSVSSSLSPSISPSPSPSLSPSKSPSLSPSLSPSVSPSSSISPSDSLSPSASPSVSPSTSLSPSISPSLSPSLSPSASPSLSPSTSPSLSPSPSPSLSPSKSPSKSPSISPSISPSLSPSVSQSPIIRASSTATTNNGTNIVFTKPTGTIEGDFMLVHIHWNQTVTVSSVPSGWTLLGTFTPGGDDRGSVYYKKAGASEPASYQWDWSSGSAYASGGIVSIYNQNPSFSFGADGTNWTGNADVTGSEITTDVGITPLAGDSLILIFAGDSTTNLGTWTITVSDPGMSEVYEADSTLTTSGCASGSRPQSTGTGLGQVVNSTGGGRGEIFLLAISPAVSSISPSVSPSSSLSPSPSPSLSASSSLSPSPSPSVSPSTSLSPSFSPSGSPSVSLSPSVSPSLSPSTSVSPSTSLSPSLSPSKSPSPSPSVSPSPSPPEWTNPPRSSTTWVNEDKSLV